jgi:aminopeptidase N
MFKRPEPADFFRTMEDASGIDLDWFWRGWFNRTDHVDISIDEVSLHRIDTQDPAVEKQRRKREREAEPTTKSAERNAALPKRTDEHPGLLDFYNKFDELDVTPKDRRDFERYLEGLEPEERDLLKLDMNFYVVELSNVGGLVMPVILEAHYEDGTAEEIRIPAEVWRRNHERISTMLMTEKTLERLVLDPHLETADADLSNNHYPPRIEESRFELFKRDGDRKNPMQEARDEQERAEKEAAEGEGGDEDDG